MIKRARNKERTTKKLLKPAVLLNMLEDLEQTKLELQQSEEKFRMLMEQSTIAIQIMTPDGKITQVNDAYSKLWDVSREELSLIHKKYNILKDDQIRALGFMPLIEKAFAGEVVTLPVFEYTPEKTTSVKIRGRKRWVQSQIYSIKDKNDTIQSVVMMHEDVTERQEAFAKLQESETKYSAVVNGAHDSINIIQDGKLVFTNHATVKITGY